jgi:hypothetical protein
MTRLASHQTVPGPKAGANASAQRARTPVHPLVALGHSLGNRQFGQILEARAAAGAGTIRETSAQADRDPGLRSGAQLSGELRSSLETYFSTSLDCVKVHSDSESQAAADRLNASAFTVGQDIHLGPEGVRTSGPAKAALLAHEVVHTLQQGPIAARAKPRLGLPDDAFEQQADMLAAGFSRFNRNPQDSLALLLRDSLRIRQVSGDAPIFQRSRLPTHFGEFEDYKYQDLTDSAGTKCGVEVYMKFHPGTHVSADLIGLTQAAEGKRNGTQITQGIYGQHSATTGAGVGSFIDRLEGYPNPVYATTQNVVAGGSAAKLADYETRGITALTPAQQTAQAAASGITGQHYTGWGQHGFRKAVGAAGLVTQPAEFYDAPSLPGAGANSEQVFETAALAIAGSQSGTYYGSVEWGWRKDAAGAFSRVPFRVVSQGVPSVTFLTAASIWNPSKASFGYVATTATDLLDVGLHRLSAIPNNAQLVPTGRQAAGGGVTYFEVTFAGNTGLVVSTAVRPATIGAETVDLPVPVVHRVSNPAGTTMILQTPLVSLTPGQPPATTLALPTGTRVVTTRSMAPQGALTNHYEGEVADGPQTGTRGYFFAPDLTLEALGTH